MQTSGCFQCCESRHGSMLGSSRHNSWACRPLHRRQLVTRRLPRRHLSVSSQLGSHYHTNSGMFESWDPDTEEYRTERRTTYNFHDWKKHRSWERYFRHFKTLPRSGIFNSLLRPVAWVAGFSAVIVAYVKAMGAGLLPSWLPVMLFLPIEPFQLTSFALSLLLVFRTNSSYQRWFEGRRRFGAVTHFSRDLARQAFAYFKPHDVERKAMFARWLVAFFTSVYCQLREGADLQASLQPLLRPAELKQALNSSNSSNFCLQMLSSLISSSGISSQIIAKMDHDLTLIVDALSSCERIVSTPIPLSYTRHTARFMMLWLFALPFALWVSCGWLTVPITIIVSFILLGIEEIGVQIEEPFGILAMERMCERNKEHVFSMYREHLNVLRTVQKFESDSHFAEEWWKNQTEAPAAAAAGHSGAASPSTASPQSGTASTTHMPSPSTTAQHWHGSPNGVVDHSHQPHAHHTSSHSVDGSLRNGTHGMDGSLHNGTHGMDGSHLNTGMHNWSVLPDPHEVIHPLPSFQHSASPSHAGSSSNEATASRSENGTVSKREESVTRTSKREESTRNGSSSSGSSSAGTPVNGVRSSSNGRSRLSSLRPEARREHATAGREPVRSASKSRSPKQEHHTADCSSPLQQAVLMSTYLQPY